MISRQRGFFRMDSPDAGIRWRSIVMSNIRHPPSKAIALFPRPPMRQDTAYQPFSVATTMFRSSPSSLASPRGSLSSMRSYRRGTTLRA